MHRMKKFILDQGTVFKELCIEFFLSISVEANTVDPHFATSLVFRHGSQFIEGSLAEFVRRMGLYEQHEEMSPIFDTLFRAAAHDYSYRINGYGFLTIIANGRFHSVVSQKSQI